MSLRFLVESHYVSVRADAEFWRPHVTEIARRHGLPMDPYEVTLGDATNPVFFVGDAVLKLYTPYFHGRESRGLEAATLRALAHDPTLPTPRVLYRGDLVGGSTDWNWPYVFMTRMKGRILGADWTELPPSARTFLAEQIGKALKRIHAVSPTPDLSELWKLHWPRGFSEFLVRQQESLLLDNEVASLPIGDDLRELSLSGLGPSWPSILHGDLTLDHVYHDRGTLTGIIDFGDAKLGDPLYDFVSLRFDMFQDDADLMRACMAAYGLDPQRERDFVRRMTAYTLLHEWRGARDLTRWTMKSGARSIRELGEWLWGGYVTG